MSHTCLRSVVETKLQMYLTPSSATRGLQERKKNLDTRVSQNAFFLLYTPHPFTLYVSHQDRQGVRLSSMLRSIRESLACTPLGSSNAYTFGANRLPETLAIAAGSRSWVALV
jgi:hypothetical protein